MKNPAKVTLIYSPGGFGPRETFYTEKIVVKFDSIEYKKEWEVNKPSRRDYSSCFDKVDISWKIRKPDQGFVQPLHELNSFLGYDVGNNVVFPDVCDGDWLDFEVITPDGNKIINGFSPCGNPILYNRIKEYLVPFIPSNLPMPELLKDYDEDQDE